MKEQETLFHSTDKWILPQAANDQPAQDYDGHQVTQKSDSPVDPSFDRSDDIPLSQGSESVTASAPVTDPSFSSSVLQVSSLSSKASESPDTWYTQDLHDHSSVNGPESVNTEPAHQVDFAPSIVPTGQSAGVPSEMILARQLMSAGVDFVSSTVVSYALAWVIGAQFTLPSFWRIIIGTGLAFATHAVRIYRIIRS